MRYCLAKKNMLEKIVDFHVQNFESYFLTNLGEDILRKYYSQFIHDDNCYFIICIDDNEKILGICLFIDDYEIQIKKFYKKNFFTLSTTMFYKILTNQTIRSNFFSKVRGIFRLGMDEKSDEKLPFHYTLLSLATSKEARGKGIAPKMINFGENTLKDKNISGYYLSVINENIGAVNFYKKNNFIFFGKDKNLSYFYKNLGDNNG